MSLTAYTLLGFVSGLVLVRLTRNTRASKRLDALFASVFDRNPRAVAALVVCLLWTLLATLVVLFLSEDHAKSGLRQAEYCRATAHHQQSQASHQQAYAFAAGQARRAGAEDVTQQPGAKQCHCAPDENAAKDESPHAANAVADHSHHNRDRQRYHVHETPDSLSAASIPQGGAA